ncbi:hypothetical protein M2158_000702 [Streptomyces sp. SAI-144]|nr:hypothetical protein [Streptomyces sp. SAI-144]MDH6492408.1 hypothetical protein [Streptomyces sp. SAI-127]
MMPAGQDTSIDSGTGLTDNGVRPCRSSPAAPHGVSPEQRAVLETRGRRAIEFGAAWFIGGLLVAVVTLGQAQGAGVYFVVWLPMLYGVHRIVSGFHLIRKSRELS